MKFYLIAFREVTRQDGGYYECQISTEPKMSRFVHLKIMGALKLHIDDHNIIHRDDSSGYKH